MYKDLVIGLGPKAKTNQSAQLSPHSQYTADIIRGIQYEKIRYRSAAAISFPKQRFRIPRQRGNQSVIVIQKDTPTGDYIESKSTKTYRLRQEMSTTPTTNSSFQIVRTASRRTNRSKFRSRPQSVIENRRDERYIFAVEWFDQEADVIRKYSLTFYPSITQQEKQDNTKRGIRKVEMYDNTSRRILLKREKNPEVGMDELFIGNTISIFERQLKITEYGDAQTRQQFDNPRASYTKQTLKSLGQLTTGVNCSVDTGVRKMLRAHRGINRNVKRWYKQGESKKDLNQLKLSYQAAKYDRTKMAAMRAQSCTPGL